MRITQNRRQILVGLGGGALTAIGNSACAPKAVQKTPASPSYDAEIIILGAGLAGLHAAHLLAAAGRDVLVLEANDRVGGRIYTLPHNGAYTEGGSARFGANDARLKKAAEDLALSFTQINTSPAAPSFWIGGQAVSGSEWTAAQASKQASNQQDLYRAAASDLHISGGAQRLPEAMARRLPRAPVLKTYIQSIDPTAQGIAATDHRGRIWRAPKMICTLPFGSLRHLRVNVPLPDLQKAAIARLPYQQNLQIHFRAKTAFWEKDNFGADMRTDGLLGQITAKYDNAGNPVGLFQSRLNDAAIKTLFQKGEKHLHRQFRAELFRLRPSTYAAIEILDVVNWTSNNRAAGGAAIDWAAKMPTGWTDVMGRPAGHLYFAGSHLGVQHKGMEGAMESAERAAALIL